MKIRTERGNAIDIMGIYWVLSVDHSSTETILLGLPKKSGGLVPYRITGKFAEKVEFIDSSIPDGFIYYYSGIYHRALIEENLLDDLREYDETAYKRFLEILKAEGRIDQDFY
ncbi:TPA: hypothetical protein ACJTCA_004039 [Yersinia enterocolitica]|uniref:hypothetical protein n=1 Tax=Yersinia enterocolitica TaxID=630 RepID=UPI00094BAAAB|nr:hypothetical protein [Yersinia enterocolitica]HDL8054488.1 hypothetical protein [Yersinia enterocolitica]HDM8436467.1 hypothetical protein [Yersinia enterocolitica]HEI6849667.1 hypothetical protein [Yersinia enterocolitica]HEN3598835.1 hypothetical protein [Yersinia enterocolitica]HEN3672461.1 hypothetical protein [Yersinia enterocolitica]